MIENEILTFLQNTISLTPGVDLFLEDYPAEDSTGAVLKLLSSSDNLTPFNYTPIVIIISYRDYWQTRELADKIFKSLKDARGYSGTWSIAENVRVENYGKEENGFYHYAVTGTVIHE